MTEDESKSVASFREKAQEFCLPVESYARFSRKEFLSRIHTSLVDLYAAALRLPEVEWEEPVGGSLSAEVRHQTVYEPTYRALLGKLGDTATYTEIFDPFENSAPISGSLADDLADIYADLKDGLRILEQTRSVTSAVWDWRFSFMHHWGIHHLADALKAISWLLFDRLEEEADDNKGTVGPSREESGPVE